jgi:osmotically-inducible protein OsmY
MLGEADLKEPANKVSSKIEQSLKRNADVDANVNGIRVTGTGGVVTLTGTVRSYAEKQQAQHAEWLAPDVTAVRDELVIAG